MACENTKFISWSHKGGEKKIGINQRFVHCKTLLSYLCHSSQTSYLFSADFYKKIIITEQVRTLEIFATDKTCIDIVCGESNRAELLKIEI